MHVTHNKLTSHLLFLFDKYVRGCRAIAAITTASREGRGGSTRHSKEYRDLLRFQARRLLRRDRDINNTPVSLSSRLAADEATALPTECAVDRVRPETVPTTSPVYRRRVLTMAKGAVTPTSEGGDSDTTRGLQLPLLASLPNDTHSFGKVGGKCEIERRATARWPPNTCHRTLLPSVAHDDFFAHLRRGTSRRQYVSATVVTLPGRTGQTLEPRLHFH